MKEKKLFVDVTETTKKTMKEINDGIIDILDEQFLKSSTLKTIEKQIGEISGKFKTFDSISKEIENLKKKQQELAKKLSEAQLSQTGELDSLEKAIKDKLSEHGKSVANNHKAVLEQVKSMDAKIEANSRRLEEIAEKLEYFSLPWYKRIGKKPGGNSAPETNTEGE